ncbi:MAG: Ornithine cyclodeaminase, partial [uncultured Solirubrobacteraceae bacterium]
VPGVRLRVGGSHGGCRRAHEVLQRGRDGRGLLGRGAGGDHLELGAAVRHARPYATERAADDARPRRRARRRLRRGGDLRCPRRVRPPPPRRVDDAVEGLPRVAAVRRLPRDARARWRRGDPQVDLLVPAEPPAWPPDGHRSARGQRRDDLRAAGGHGRRRGDRAAHR